MNPRIDAALTRKALDELMSWATSPYRTHVAGSALIEKIEQIAERLGVQLKTDDCSARVEPPVAEKTAELVGRVESLRLWARSLDRQGNLGQGDRIWNLEVALRSLIDVLLK